MSDVIDCTDPEQRSRGIASARGAVKNGGLVVLPTDTVYGVGADAFDSAAVAALLAAKGRGRDMPVPVLVGSWHTIDGLALSVSKAMRDLIRAFWPGALSLVVRQGPSGPGGVRDAPGAMGAVGSRRRSGHGDAAYAVAPRRDRIAARGRADGGIQRQRVRPAAGSGRAIRPRAVGRSCRHLSRCRSVGPTGRLDDPGLDRS